MTTTTGSGRFKQIGEEIGSLVEEKNAAYGNSFGKVAEFLKILWPDGIPVEAYTDALCTVRMFDKLMRIANKKDAFGESPYRDIAGYSILGVEKDERETAPQKTEAKTTEEFREFIRAKKQSDAARDLKIYSDIDLEQTIRDIKVEAALNASKAFFSEKQVEEFAKQVPTEEQQEEEPYPIHLNDGPVPYKETEIAIKQSRTVRKFDEVAEKLLNESKSGPFIPVTVWVRGQERLGRIEEIPYNNVKVNNIRRDPRTDIQYLYIMYSNGKLTSIQTDEITRITQGEETLYDARPYLLIKKAVNYDALNDILSNPDEVMVLTATIQEEMDKQGVKEPGRLNLTNESEKKATNVPLPNSIEEKAVAIQDWLEENVSNPTANEITVWQTFTSSLYKANGLKVDVGDVVRFPKKFPNISWQILKIACGVAFIQDVDDQGRTQTIDFFEKGLFAQKQIKIKFGSEAEKKTWYEITSTSKATPDEVVDKLIEMMNLQTEGLVQAKAKEQNHNIVATMEVDDTDDANNSSVCMDHE